MNKFAAIKRRLAKWCYYALPLAVMLCSYALCIRGIHWAYLNPDERKITLEYWKEGNWEEFYRGTVIGYKKICCFETIETNRIRLTITASRWYPEISELGIYYYES